MDVLYRRGNATAAEVRDGLPDAPSATAVRTLLRILEEKGQITHDVDGVRHIYRPMVPREEARASVIDYMVRTFFGGSKAQAAAALLGDDSSELSGPELARLAELVADARRRKT